MILASKLSDMGISNVKIYDVSVTDSSYLIAEAFRVSHIVLASTTYNAGIFVKMENFITDLVDHNLQNRNFAIIENGSWASTAGSLMIGHLSKLKNTNFIGEKFKITSSLKADQLNELDELASLIKNQVMPVKETVVLEKIDNNAMFKLSYGLFLLSTELNGFQNGCIINTVTQITDSKKRISIAVNKANHTHDMLLKSKKFNISILTTETPFSVFEQYGFSSGRDADKFKGATNIAQMENGINYLNEYTNAVLSGEVTDTINFDTHTLFIAEITEAKTLSSQKSVTYDYYFANIKPKPAVSSGQAKGFVCKICAFVYEGENLPSDYICPLCKHGVSDFEKL